MARDHAAAEQRKEHEKQREDSGTNLEWQPRRLEQVDPINLRRRPSRLDVGSPHEPRTGNADANQ